MINLHQHIEYLLIKHDCVIIPGLGAFVAHYETAQIVGNTMLPPKRLVGFNREITHNDGLLASSIARKQSIGYEKAVSKLNVAVSSLKAQLYNDGEVVFPHVGRLISTDDGSNIVFKPSEHSIASLRYTGLPTVELSTNIEQQPVEDEKNTETTGNIIYVPIHKAIIRVAAAIAILLGVGMVCSTPRIIDQATINMASLAPQPRFIEMEQEILSSNTNDTLYIKTPDIKESQKRVNFIARQRYQNKIARREARLAAQEEMRKAREAAVAEALAAKEAKAAESTKTQSTANDNGEYCIVVASFNSKSGARKWIESQGSRDLKILSQDGRYRVYSATASTEQEAKDMAHSAKIQKRYPGAWVSRK